MKTEYQVGDIVIIKSKKELKEAWEAIADRTKSVIPTVFYVDSYGLLAGRKCRIVSKDDEANCFQYSLEPLDDSPSEECIWAETGWDYEELLPDITEIEME